MGSMESDARRKSLICRVTEEFAGELAQAGPYDRVRVEVRFHRGLPAHWSVDLTRVTKITTLNGEESD